MREIELIGGNKTLVDDEDYDWLIKDYVWFLYYSGEDLKYARGKKRIYNRTEQHETFQIHKLIMEKYHNESQLIIDHKDHDGLNNQKYNLRYATHSQNMANKRKQKLKITSKYKGVSFDKKRNRWCMNVTLNGNIVAHRKFLNERYAAIAYDIKAKEYFGEFALINIQDVLQEEIEKVMIILKNPKKHYNCSSKYLGVRKNKNDRWQVEVRDSNKNKVYIGSFDDEIEAAKAYNVFLEKTSSPHKHLLNNVEISELERISIEKYIFGNKKMKNTLSKYLCVTKNKKRWSARINLNGKYIHIGTFDTEKEAAIAYNEKATELLGNKAKLNVID